MSSYKKVGMLFFSALIAVLFSISSNIHSIETITTNYSKEVRASHQDPLIHHTFENYYLPQSSNETFPFSEFVKYALPEIKSEISISTIEYCFYYQKIVYHRQSSSEIVFPTHFFW